MKRVTILAVEGCMSSGVTGLLDVFSIANTYWALVHPKDTFPFFDVEIVTITGKEVSSFNQFPVFPHKEMEKVGSTDIIIIPPVISDIENSIRMNREIIPWLKSHYRKDTILSSICTGVFFIAETGLLDGKSATTNQGVSSLFQERYPQINLNLHRIIVDNGDILCAGSTYSFRELSIYLIEKHCGHEVAVQCSKVLLIDKNRISQAPYFVSQQQKDHQDQKIHDIQNWIEKNYTQNISIDSLISRAGMSNRSFIRRFKNATGDTFSMYIQRLRIEAAKYKLETTQLTIDEITYQVGYENSRSFSRLFKKHTNLSPGDYRKKFAAMVD